VWAGSQAAKQRSDPWQVPAAQPSQQPAAVSPGYVAPSQSYAPIAPPNKDSVEDGNAADEEERNVFFDIALTTQAPLFMGGQLSLELPGRLLLQGDIGYMPEFYGSAINGMMQSFGGYEPTTAALIDAALDGAVVARASLGWRPFASAGFEFSAGYTSITLDGDVSPEDVAGVVQGEFASEIANSLEQDISLSSQLHNFHVALGWRWVAFDHLLIRANVGYTQTLASSSSVEIPDNATAERLANERIDDVLDPIYTTYAKLPTIGLGAGYRF
jgi:hypothetical protein